MMSSRESGVQNGSSARSSRRNDRDASGRSRSRSRSRERRATRSSRSRERASTRRSSSRTRDGRSEMRRGSVRNNGEEADGAASSRSRRRGGSSSRGASEERRREQDPRFIDTESSEDEEDEEMRLEHRRRLRQARTAGPEGVAAAGAGVLVNMNAAEQGLNEEELRTRVMGFSGFSSTKGKEVLDNKETAARGWSLVRRRRKHRQYMNRIGGFNRNLAKDVVFTKE